MNDGKRQFMGNTLAYRVNDIRIVSPTDTKALKIRKDGTRSHY